MTVPQTSLRGRPRDCYQDCYGENYAPNASVTALYDGLSTPLDPKHRRAVGLGRDHADRHHRLLVEQRNAEGADHFCKCKSGFDQCKMRPDADARTDAERQIGKTVG